MTTSYDPAVMKGIRCPLCESIGTLRPIRLGKRLRAGPWSFLLTVLKSFECTGCGATLSTDQLLRDKQSA